MQSKRIRSVINRIVREKKIVHYWNDHREVQSLKDLRAHLDSVTDYIDIHIYTPPSQNLINVFSSDLLSNINYIKVLFGWVNDFTNPFDWNLVTPLLEAANDKSFLISFQNVASEEVARLFGQWNLRFKMPLL